MPSPGGGSSVDDVGGAGERVRRDDREQLLGQAGADERAAHGGGGARRGGCEQHRVAGEQGGADLEQRRVPGRAVAHVDAGDAERRLHERGAPARPERRDGAEPAVGERVRALGGEAVQPAHRGQQLGERRLAARLPGLGGEQVGQRVELVQDGLRRPAQVARAVARRDERPHRLRGGGDSPSHLCRAIGTSALIIA